MWCAASGFAVVGVGGARLERLGALRVTWVVGVVGVVGVFGSGRAVRGSLLAEAFRRGVHDLSDRADR